MKNTTKLTKKRIKNNKKTKSKSIENKKSKKYSNNYHSKCFINKRYKILPFFPETENKYLSLNQFMYKAKHIFPIKKNIKSTEDFKRLKMSKIGLYSMSYINLGKKIISIIKDKMSSTNKLVLTEANGGVGGLSLEFIDNFKKTNIIEVNKFHLDIIEHNLKEYGFNKFKYQLYNKDALDFIFQLKSDIIVFDPPWFGKKYKKKTILSLGLNNVELVCIINKLIKQRKCKLIILLIPENFNFEKFLNLLELRTFNMEIHQVFIKKNKKQSIISICR